MRNISFCVTVSLIITALCTSIYKANADKTHQRIKLLQRSAQEEALVGHVIQSTTSSSDMDCLVDCTRKQRCLSFNYKNKKGDGKPVCELNDQTRETKPDSVVPMNDYYYYGPESPCTTPARVCLNGGSCQQAFDEPEKRYQCHCLPGSTGQHCENMAADFDINFPRRGSLDYVVLLDKMPQLDNFSISLFVNLTEDRDHTFVSYASPSFTNDIFIHQRASKIHLWVSNLKKRFDLLCIRADGAWHHLAMTWENVKGKVSVYIDGSVSATVDGFAVGKTVQPNGKFVLGNDQDSYGGGFVNADALRGSITRINVWNTVLSSDVIASFARACGNMDGSAVAWRDFKKGAAGVSYHGEAKFTTPSTCKTP